METLEEFIRYNEKMNSSLITDWSREMLLEAFKIWTDKQLSIRCVSNLDCVYKGKNIRFCNTLEKYEVSVFDGDEWRYLFNAKTIEDCKKVIDLWF